MKIGITERGDASRDYSWESKLSKVDGVILITKNITGVFIDKVLKHHNEGNKIIVHATCTGYGDTYLEPNVPDYVDQLKRLKKLIDSGFPKEQCVLRIDPIIPDKIDETIKVIEDALYYRLLPDIRVRISILDNYPHVRQRFISEGLNPLYNGRFTASKDDIDKVTKELGKFNLVYETCAEVKLTDPIYQHVGCISKKDIQILELSYKESTVNPQNRKGCLCLSCKTELLNNKKQCANKCLYCYWR